MLTVPTDRLIQGPVATIYVGRDKVRFTVPMNLACHLCPFFRKRFSDRAKEAEDAILDLPEDDPETFAMLLQWIYQDGIAPINLSEREEASSAMQTHLRLYLLASRFELPSLQNETMQHIRVLYELSRDHAPIDAPLIFEIYRSEYKKPALCRFVCDAAAKEFLDCGKLEQNRYGDCLSSIPAFTLQFTDALHDYHDSRKDFITDCPERYLTYECGAQCGAE